MPRCRVNRDSGHMASTGLSSAGSSVAKCAPQSSSAPVSSVLVAGQRFCLTASGADVTVLVKSPQRSPYGWNQLPADGVRAGYNVVQLLVDVFPSPVVAVRWFGDDGGSTASCLQSIDGSNSPSGTSGPGRTLRVRPCVAEGRVTCGL